MANETKKAMNAAGVQMKCRCAALPLLTVLFLAGLSASAASAQLNVAGTTPQTFNISVRMAGLPRTITLCRDPEAIAQDDWHISEYSWYAIVFVDGGYFAMSIASKFPGSPCVPHEVATGSALEAKGWIQELVGPNSYGQPRLMPVHFDLDFDHAAMVMRVDQSQPLVGTVSSDSQITVKTSLAYQDIDELQFARGVGTVRVTDPPGDSSACTVSCPSADWLAALDLTEAAAGTDPESYQTDFAIQPGITGGWFDPEQSGHGLMLEVLSDHRLLAMWFAFNPEGNQQSWFGGVGTYSGATATITDVALPTGGRWIPNFDPNSIVRSPWGTLTFTFTDCDRGRVDFNSGLGYGSGSMNILRLTRPAGLTCP